MSASSGSYQTWALVALPLVCVGPQNEADWQHSPYGERQSCAVLFLDTCIFLDIVRSPLRNKASEVQFARMFFGSAQKNPKTVHLLIAPPIQTEWNDNIDTTVNDCTAVSLTDAESVLTAAGWVP
jgi:hypothetical protein